jgi:hypothetical protein
MVFENRLLRGVFRRRCWRKLYVEELHNLYSSGSIVSMIVPRRMEHEQERRRKPGTFC